MKLFSVLILAATLLIGHLQAQNTLGVHEVTITGNDTMQFDIKNFEVKPGVKVKLTLKNVGQVPKIAMGHNLVVLKKRYYSDRFRSKSIGCRS